MSFYRSFRSKDELVCAYLEASAAEYWLWWDEVIGERERALAVLGSVSDEALVGFCALERATLVAVLGNAARRSDDQRG